MTPLEKSDAERAIRATVGWWDSGWEAFAELDPGFLARTVDLVAVPWSDAPGGLDRATKHLVAIALHAACTTGDRAAIEGHVRAAQDEGIELPAIVEVLELASALGMQSCTVGLPILVEQLAARSQYEQRDLTEDEVRVREAFVARRGYWSDFWENLLRLSPRFMEGYLALSTVPWESGPLPPKVKELVYVAINASPNHLHEPSIRLHIGNALDRGATAQELVEVLELVTIVGVNACRDGHSVLAGAPRGQVEEG